MAKRPTKKDTPFDFEASLAELESLVERMEQGDMSLEQSLHSFERGIQLTRACQQALRDAEQKVEMLMEKGQGETLVPLDPPTEP